MRKVSNRKIKIFHREEGKKPPCWLQKKQKSDVMIAVTFTSHKFLDLKKKTH